MSALHESVARRSPLPPARAFTEASARVEAALQELRGAERALEAQLRDLRAHLRWTRAPTADSATIVQ